MPEREIDKHESSITSQNVSEIESEIQLPANIDNSGVIFSYGYLLDLANLQELIAKKRESFQIYESSSPEEAAQLAIDHPGDLVVLHGVTLEGIRASVVSQQELRDMYAEIGLPVDELVEEGLIDQVSPQETYLYARPAEPGERSKSLQGGLIIGLTPEELAMLDRYEFEPLYQRQPTPALKINGQVCKPNHITFYAGNAGDISKRPGHWEQVSKILSAERRPGESSVNAKWPENVRRDP